jgi:hypothetical protein
MGSNSTSLSFTVIISYVKEAKMPKGIRGQKIIENWLNLNGYLLVQKKIFGGVVVSKFVKILK